MGIEEIWRAIARDGALAICLIINMFYLGRKLDRLTEVILKNGKGKE